MPEMVGHDTMQAIREFDNETPIIAMTAKDKAMSYPFVKDFFIKPVTVEQLERLTEIV